MSMIFQFRMLCDEDDYFLREYEVPYDMTLAAFRDFINKDLQYRPEELTSFFTADDRWNKLQEFTAMDMGATESDGELLPQAMDRTLLSQVVRKKRDRLIYQFDVLGDRACFLEGGTGQALSGRNACRRRCSRPVSCRGGKRKRFRFRRRDGRFQRFRRHRRLWR